MVMLVKSASFIMMFLFFSTFVYGGGILALEPSFPWKQKSALAQFKLLVFKPILGLNE